MEPNPRKLGAFHDLVPFAQQVAAFYRRTDRAGKNVAGLFPAFARELPLQLLPHLMPAQCSDRNGRYGDRAIADFALRLPFYKFSFDSLQRAVNLERSCA